MPLILVENKERTNKHERCVDRCDEIQKEMEGTLLDRDAFDVVFIEAHGDFFYLTETSVCQQDFEFWTDEVHLCLVPIGRARLHCWFEIRTHQCRRRR